MFANIIVIIITFDKHQFASVKVNIDVKICHYDQEIEKNYPN